MTESDATIGKIYLVGAGPGDPGLITLRGVECLRRADAVLYDYLVNPRLIKHAPAAAELVCLGRHGHGRIWTQEEINERLIELARQGKTVVRLKGGDPAVFAHVAEELEILTRHNIPFEIVPGITAALAVSSYAGIPITHRDFSSAVALITGQENPDKSDSSLDFDALARFPGTLVFYMGVTTAEHWTEALVRAGKPSDTPAAIIRRCSFADQATIHCTLGEVVTRLTTPQKMRPPVIVIVGEVASLGSALTWFEKRPLFGTTVLVTRPEEQVASLRDRLEELGAQVLEQPAIRISDPPDWSPVDDAIDRLGQFDWLVFTSANGVRCFIDRLIATGRDLRHLAGLKIASIGPATSEQLSHYRLNADLQPDEYRAEALAAALAAGANGKRFLLARASRARAVLADHLNEAGGHVESVVVYSHSDVDDPDAEIAGRMREGNVDWVTVTSSAIARSLAAMFGEDLRRCRLASISPVTSATLRELGFEPAAEATHYTMPGVVQAILSASAESD